MLASALKPIAQIPSDKGPFYHGTKADLISTMHNSNYGEENKANFVYFTATLEAAIWGAELALGQGRERIYKVEPLEAFEHNPNLTDKKFPGNPPEVLKQMKDRLEALKKDGIKAIDE